MKLLNSIINRFTQVPNDLIMDKSISAQSRFLFVYLAMRPDNWQWNNNEIMDVVGCKKNSLTKYFNELINAGWLSKYQQKGEQGKFGSNIIELHAEKQTVSQNLGDGSPCPKKSATEKIRNGKNGTHNNKEFSINTDSITKTEYPHGFVEERHRECFDMWLDYKGKNAYKVKYLPTLYKNMMSLSGGDPERLKLIIEQSIGNGWKGLFPLKGVAQPSLFAPVQNTAPVSNYENESLT